MQRIEQMYKPMLNSIDDSPPPIRHLDQHKSTFVPYKMGSLKKVTSKDKGGFFVHNKSMIVKNRYASNMS